jgi:hypothetical protein
LIEEGILDEAGVGKVRKQVEEERKSGGREVEKGGEG